MFVCLHIVHFAKLRILQNEHDISIYFACANNELIACVIYLNVLLEIAITQRTGKEL